MWVVCGFYVDCVWILCEFNFDPYLKLTTPNNNKQKIIDGKPWQQQQQAIVDKSRTGEQDTRSIQQPCRWNMIMWIGSKGSEWATRRELLCPSSTHQAHITDPISGGWHISEAVGKKTLQVTCCTLLKIMVFSTAIDWRWTDGETYRMVIWPVDCCGCSPSWQRYGQWACSMEAWLACTGLRNNDGSAKFSIVTNNIVTYSTMADHHQ